MIWSEEILGGILGSLLTDGIMVLVAFLLLFLALKIIMVILGAEENRVLPIPLSEAQCYEKANTYIQIAEALEEGDRRALLWLMSRNTQRRRIFRALNSFAVDLFLGTASLLSILSLYIKVRALPVQDWIVIIMVTAALVLIGISYWRVKS
ncbi:MAG: hypothetical protein KIH08_14000 [Candidatus Freyarchaeota archaeon]|nr:hypothetical protein [Candidatus Jordarchaeia archaeon]MBS7267917.1 hypothetical protein [Candidatus Jordarchaeia archaeon]MBS7280677.1 hypothetical protein [Candidatus Jordarchaeia archaeon]